MNSSKYISYLIVPCGHQLQILIFKFHSTASVSLDMAFKIFISLKQQYLLEQHVRIGINVSKLVGKGFYKIVDVMLHVSDMFAELEVDQMLMGSQQLCKRLGVGFAQMNL